MTDVITHSPLDIVEEVIVARRTVKQFLPLAVASETLKRLIECAVWAPNHRLNEPWRFYVLGEQAQAQLAEIADALTERKILAARRRPPPVKASRPVLLG